MFNIDIEKAKQLLWSPEAKITLGVDGRYLKTPTYFLGVTFHILVYRNNRSACFRIL